jgi:hypothetical protein
MSDDSSAVAANGAKEDGSANMAVAVFNHNGENWDETNLETLSEWVQIGSLQIETLDLGIRKYRSIIRQNVLLGLILSTASGSISISQISSTQQQFVLNVFFTVMTFSIAIFTGLIKIYQIQERLEEYIQLKQEWIAFCVNITSEIQLPVSQRRDALRIIKDYKSKYLDLLKIDVDIGTSIKEKALENLYDDRKLQYIEEQASYLKLRNEINNGIYEETASVCPTETHESLQKNSAAGCLYWNHYFNGICKKKFDGRKTSLSNILLTIMLEEEKTERDKRMAKLMKMKTEKHQEDRSHNQNMELREPVVSSATEIMNKTMHLTKPSASILMSPTNTTTIDMDDPQFHLSEPTN